MSIILFSDVSQIYPGEIRAISHVSLAIEEGELVFLMGPSGAGKSTLLKLMAGIEMPSAGVLQIIGQDMKQLHRAALPYLRRKLGLILQQNSLLNDRSVLANVMLPLMVVGAIPEEAEQRARVALTRVGLANKTDVLPYSLSGGEQQRVSIARAIVHKPRIILADEPTANLDRDSARLVLDMLQAFNDAGVTCVISTHDERLLERASKIFVLEHGRITAMQMPGNEVGL
jgi:cell division transport system ATP-binding protein